MITFYEYLQNEGADNLTKLKQKPHLRYRKNESPFLQKGDLLDYWRGTIKIFGAGENTPVPSPHPSKKDMGSSVSVNLFLCL